MRFTQVRRQFRDRNGNMDYLPRKYGITLVDAVVDCESVPFLVDNHLFSQETTQTILCSHANVSYSPLHTCACVQNTCITVFKVNSLCLQGYKQKKASSLPGAYGVHLQGLLEDGL